MTSRKMHGRPADRISLENSCRQPFECFPGLLFEGRNLAQNMFEWGPDDDPRRCTAVFNQTHGLCYHQMSAHQYSSLLLSYPEMPQQLKFLSCFTRDWSILIYLKASINKDGAETSLWILEYICTVVLLLLQHGAEKEQLLFLLKNTENMWIHLRLRIKVSENNKNDFNMI